MEFLQTLTNTQLTRLYNRILQRIYRVFAGGTQFGVDYPTLCAVYPELGQTYKMVRKEGRRRKQSGLAPE